MIQLPGPGSYRIDAVLAGTTYSASEWITVEVEKPQSKSMKPAILVIHQYGKRLCLQIFAEDKKTPVKGTIRILDSEASGGRVDLEIDETGCREYEVVVQGERKFVTLVLLGADSKQSQRMLFFRD